MMQTIMLIEVKFNILILGIILRKLGKFDEAISMYDQALQLYQQIFIKI